MISPPVSAPPPSLAPACTRPSSFSLFLPLLPTIVVIAVIVPLRSRLYTHTLACPRLLRRPALSSSPVELTDGVRWEAGVSGIVGELILGRLMSFRF